MVKYSNDNSANSIVVNRECGPPDKGRYMNEFMMEMTPKNPVINPDDPNPLRISLKCVAKEKQEVTIQVDSFLFEIKDPRARSGTISQIYQLMAPGETMVFWIGVMKDTPPETLEKAVADYMSTPEGTFLIYHQNTTKTGDSDKDWRLHTQNDTVSNPKPGERIIQSLRANPYTPHGSLQMEMYYTHVTDALNARRNLFDEAVRRRRCGQGNGGEVTRLDDKKKEKKKKCCSCTVL